MGRGEKVWKKKYGKRRIHFMDKGSDKSDEDYMVGEDEACNDSDEYYSSFAGEESEESLPEFEEEEEEEEERKVKRSNKQNDPARTKSKVRNVPKKRRIPYKEEDDKDYEDEDFDDVGDDDEEFTPDEFDLDDEDELSAKKRLGRPPSWEKGSVKKLKGNRKIFKKPIRKKPRTSREWQRKSVANNCRKFTGRNTVVKRRNKKSPCPKRRRLIANSDSDFLSSESSNCEYTISEEEREQIREASEFCRNLTRSLRNSSSTNKLLEEGPLCQQRKQPKRKSKVETQDLSNEGRRHELDVHQQSKQLQKKGKEKVDDVKNKVGRQVCGICLSEEGKRRIQGTLNCCSHYFCFACIIEWSKVESRCPLCKQRFVTISKPARSNTGFDLRTVVIQVPECDQVYQPTEEELRRYLDPYETVICTECQQGGDDALMLLCDLCDSPAHTYCVGLGREVPEGNWYCEGCGPTALHSSNPQGPNPSSEQRLVNLCSGSSPVVSVREEIDLNTAYVPETPQSQGTGFFLSSRQAGGDSPASSLASRTGALTVSERRRIQHQIHRLLNNRVNEFASRNRVAAGMLGFSGNDILGAQIGQSREAAFQHAVAPERSTSHYMFSQARSQDSYRPLLLNMDFLSMPSQLIQGQTSTSADGSANAILPAGFYRMHMHANSRLDYEQSHPCSRRSNVGSDAGISLYGHKEVSQYNVGKEQVQSMVRSHLKSFSRQLELDYTTFKDIARSATHTILAVCGLEHRDTEVYPVRLPSTCNHSEAKGDQGISLLKGLCLSCFDSFVKDVVREIINTRVPPLFRV